MSARTWQASNPGSAAQVSGELRVVENRDFSIDLSRPTSTLV